jgi:hypothetical protein
VSPDFKPQDLRKKFLGFGASLARPGRGFHSRHHPKRSSPRQCWKSVRRTEARPGGDAGKRTRAGRAPFAPAVPRTVSCLPRPAQGRACVRPRGPRTSAGAERGGAAREEEEPRLAPPRREAVGHTAAPRPPRPVKMALAAARRVLLCSGSWPGRAGVGGGPGGTR